MNCLYCDQPIYSYTLRSILWKEDELCPNCRRKLKASRKIVDMEEFKVETFFEYEGIFRELLLQYKECHDEALKGVFLYDLKEYIEVRYRSYSLVFIPSSRKKREERGFNHLEGMFQTVQLKRTGGLEMKEEMNQEGKNSTERKEMIGNFFYNGPFADKILLVDDVLTTGSTLKGAYRCLKPHASNIKVLSLAYKNITLHK